MCLSKQMNGGCVNDIQSAVILDHGMGYVAYLRFTDRIHDINISHSNKYMLYRLIEGHCLRAGVR